MEMNNHSSYELALYEKEKILAAAAAYKSFCSIEISQQNQKLECTFRSDRVPVDRVMNEFDNYLIELMQCGGSTNH